ncbi:hypothetical protein GEV33_010600 [Tenebrio molitor]|uniref:Uncharacterized protein n=1 Tax=Tenebrio molitor TaxID=7067 RepID=A0A8J6HDQ7_TENMO|nr:hypothetical protein GEV33_010600 [Tenebrio molitor]
MDALVVLFGNGKFISLMDLWHLVAQRRVTNGSGDVIEWVDLHGSAIGWTPRDVQFSRVRVWRRLLPIGAVNTCKVASATVKYLSSQCRKRGPTPTPPAILISIQLASGIRERYPIGSKQTIEICRHNTFFHYATLPSDKVTMFHKQDSAEFINFTRFWRKLLQIGPCNAITRSACSTGGAEEVSSEDVKNLSEGSRSDDRLIVDTDQARPQLSQELTIVRVNGLWNIVRTRSAPAHTADTLTDRKSQKCYFSKKLLRGSQANYSGATETSTSRPNWRKNCAKLTADFDKHVGAAPFEQIQIWVLIGRNGLLQIRTNLNALRHGSGTDENHIHHTTIVIDRIAQLLFMARAQTLDSQQTVNHLSFFDCWTPVRRRGPPTGAMVKNTTLLNYKHAQLWAEWAQKFLNRKCLQFEATTEVPLGTLRKTCCRRSPNRRFSQFEVTTEVPQQKVFAVLGHDEGFYSLRPPRHYYLSDEAPQEKMISVHDLVLFGSHKSRLSASIYSLARSVEQSGTGELASCHIAQRAARRPHLAPRSSVTNLSRSTPRSPLHFTLPFAPIFPREPVAPENSPIP